MRHLLLFCALAVPAMAQERTVLLANTADAAFCLNAAARANGPVSVGNCDGASARFILREGQPGIRLAANPSYCLTMTVAGGGPTYLYADRCNAGGEAQQLRVEAQRIFSDEFSPTCAAAQRGVTAGARITTEDCADTPRQGWTARAIPTAAAAPAAWGTAAGWTITPIAEGGQFRACQAERILRDAVAVVGPVRITLNADLLMLMDYPVNVTAAAQTVTISAGQDRDRVPARPSAQNRIIFEITPPIGRTLVERNPPHLFVEATGNVAPEVPTRGFRAVWDMLNDCVDKRGLR